MIDLAAIKAAADAIREAMGDDADDEAFLDTLDGETDVLDITDWIIRKIAERKLAASSCGELAMNYREKQSRHLSAVESLRNLAGAVLAATGERKIARPTGTVSFMATQPRLVITEESEIPSQLWKITKVPDAAAIKAALTAGETIPGAELSAPGETVRIA